MDNGNNNYLFGKNHYHSELFDQKYLNGPADHHQQYSHQMRNQLLLPQIQSINTCLKEICEEKMGNLTGADPLEIQKTIQLIKSLISICRKDIESKKQYYSANRRYQADKANMINQIEKLTRQKKNLENEKENFLLKIKNMEKSYKESIDKLNFEKDQAQKQFIKIQNRQNQIQNQFRKKDIAIKNLQETIKKFQDKPSFKNSFQLMQNLQQHGVNLYHTNAEHQFNTLMNVNIQSSHASLRQQNQYYKDCLTSIYKQLHSVLQLKKEILRRRQGYDSQYDNSFDLHAFRQQTLLLPQELSNEGFDLLHQNIQKFKQAMRVGENQQKMEDQKITCVNNVKNLIRNYKHVIESQDQLLNKVILKAKQFKNNDMAQLQSKYSKNIDQGELQRARKFLDEQTQYLSTKNRQLQSTRRAMQMSIQRAEEDRTQYLRRRSQNQEEAARLRKNIELLPSMIEAQLKHQ